MTFQNGGVWVTWIQDFGKIPYTIFPDELEARRYADTQGFLLNVSFWPFGTDWNDLNNIVEDEDED